MLAYESGDFEPPAPVVRAVVRGPANASYHDVPLLIDTGADVSLIPLDVAKYVGAATHPGSALIQFLDGEQMTCLEADLTVEFHRYRFRGPFIIAESSHGLLGSNVLNLLLVTLGGPRLSWSIAG
ncbi:MAG: retropepsin-like domain-containing protein [Chloroflexi bacterium]|nr:retropepsin-like domain-containing protein [Chloroflexota bacterium]